jgi:hypothetical protein
MLRILIVATLLFLVSATSARADATPASAAASGAASGEGITIQLEIGARVGAHAFLQPAVRASLPTAVMHRTINGVVQAHRTADGRSAMLGLFDLGDDKPGLALPVSESVSLGLRYQYLRSEDIRLEVAETGSLDEAYSSHNLVLRAHWHF